MDICSEALVQYLEHRRRAIKSRLAEIRKEITAFGYAPEAKGAAHAAELHELFVELGLIEELSMEMAKGRSKK